MVLFLSFNSSFVAMPWPELRFVIIFFAGALSIGGVLYFIYHATMIAKKINERSARPHNLIFQKQLTNPAWRTVEVNQVISGDPDLERYVDRIERQKYLWIAAMWLLALIIASLFAQK
jgi:hypothetical protein